MSTKIAGDHPFARIAAQTAVPRLILAVYVAFAALMFAISVLGFHVVVGIDQLSAPRLLYIGAGALCVALSVPFAFAAAHIAIRDALK